MKHIIKTAAAALCMVMIVLSFSGCGESYDNINAERYLPDFGQYLQNVYHSGGFTKDTIDNELLLLLGWNKLGINHYELDDAHKASYYFNFNEDDTAEVRVEPEIMRDSIKQIFGDVEYEDASFEDTGYYPTYSFSKTAGKIKFEDGRYTAHWENRGGENDVELRQRIVASSINSSKMEITVCPVYLRSLIENDTVIYDVYARVDDAAGKSVDVIAENVRGDDLESVLSSNEDKFDKYKYVLLFNNEAKTYLLDSFLKVEKE